MIDPVDMDERRHADQRGKDEAKDEAIESLGQELYASVLRDICAGVDLDAYAEMICDALEGDGGKALAMALLADIRHHQTRTPHRLAGSTELNDWLFAVIDDDVTETVDRMIGGAE